MHERKWRKFHVAELILIEVLCFFQRCHHQHYHYKFLLLLTYDHREKTSFYYSKLTSYNQEYTPWFNIVSVSINEWGNNSNHGGLQVLFYVFTFKFLRKMNNGFAFASNSQRFGEFTFLLVYVSWKPGSENSGNKENRNC